MEWKVCVVSTYYSGANADLGNALLYGSQVTWVPGNKIAMAVPQKEVNLIDSTTVGMEMDFLDKVKSIGFDIHVKDCDLTSAVSLLLGSFAGTAPSRWQQNIKLYEEGVLQMISESVGDAHAALISDARFRIAPPSKWKTYQAAHELMNTMQRVLLPDVSKLRLDQIKTLQDYAKDELDPMRAEMLRLTVELRQMLDDDWNTIDLARETENLIATHVEPSIRALNSRIKSDVKRTGIEHFGQLAKTIGLLGFGTLLQSSNMKEKALTEAVGFLGDKMVDLTSLQADTASSRFVLKIKKWLAQL